MGFQPLSLICGLETTINQSFLSMGFQPLQISSLWAQNHRATFCGLKTTKQLHFVDLQPLFFKKIAELLPFSLGPIFIGHIATFLHYPGSTMPWLFSYVFALSGYNTWNPSLFQQGFYLCGFRCVQSFRGSIHMHPRVTHCQPCNSGQHFRIPG